ncbi:MAG: molybdate ABC transporter substrate-binding protein [Candidatus Latescibacterota bacterium]|nr:MAG: molybdate ABC transporter substrate-binding protein [Candidatus Latescibacterota bacterium]
MTTHPRRAGPRAQRPLFASLLLVFLLSAGCARSERSELVVFAAASLGEALEAVADSFAAGSDGAPVVLNLAASHILAAQIEEGAPADLFVSADSAQMERLVASGRARGPFVLALNRLVLLVPRGNPAGIRRLSDLAREGTRVVVGTEACPVGSYTRALLERAGLSEEIGRNVVSYEESVRGVVQKVRLGEADAGVAYATDAGGGPPGEIESIEIPEAAGMRVACFAAPLDGAEGRPEVRRFLGYLREGEGARILALHGFGRP